MPTNACSKPSTNNYVADLGEGPARTSYLQNRKAKRAGQRELCQKFVAAPPRKALAVVSRPVPLPSSPVAPADYHFRHLLLIGEKERLASLLTLTCRLMDMRLASSNRTLVGCPSLSHVSPKKNQSRPRCRSKYFCLSQRGSLFGCRLRAHCHRRWQIA